MPRTCTNPTTSLHSTYLPEPRRRPRPALPAKLQPAEAAPLNLPDLRRRDARLHTEQIGRRATFLPREQRALIAALYQHGHSYTQLAAISGQPVRRLRREVQRILHRLASPEFAFVALHLESWPATMRRVAQSCVLGGDPVRTAARDLCLSLHTVRKYRNLVRLLAAGPGNEFAASARSKAG
jgi:hypothetical protein